MDARTFFNLVKDMRAAQTLYFKSRSTGHLELAKGYEKLVDDEIARVVKILNATKIEKDRQTKIDF